MTIAGSCPEMAPPGAKISYIYFGNQTQATFSIKRTDTWPFWNSPPVVMAMQHLRSFQKQRQVVPPHLKAVATMVVVLLHWQLVPQNPGVNADANPDGETLEQQAKNVSQG